MEIADGKSLPGVGWRAIVARRMIGVSKLLEPSEHRGMSESAGWSDTDRRFRHAFWLFWLAVALYSRALFGDFVSWDDPQYILRNRMVQGGLSWTSLQNAWTTFECANWHPLTWMSLMLDYQLFGLRPWGFHLTNVLLHGMNSALLYLWLVSVSDHTRRLSSGQIWFVAAVFAVHPVHVESVAWITERKDVLATLFGLLSLLAHARWVTSGLTRWKMACTLCFALSLCAKPLFVTLPCVLLLVEFWPLRRWNWTPGVETNPSTPNSGIGSRWSFLQSVLEKWPLFALSLMSCVVTFWAQQEGGSVRTFSQVPFAARFPNAIVNYSSYLQIMVWPAQLCTFYPMSRNEWTNPQVIIASGTLILVTALGICFRRRYPGLLMGWFWFLGTLVPMIGIVQVGSQSIADRYLYVPIIGVTLALVVGLSALLDRAGISPSGRKAMSIVVVILLSGLTWRQIGTWNSTESLARHSLQVVPDNWNGHMLLGIVHDKAGRTSDAEAEYTVALKYNPEASNARNNLAILLMSQDRVKEALEHYRIGLELRPRYGIMRANFANALARQGELKRALEQYELAAEDLRNSADLHRNYGTTLILAGQSDLAIPVLERAVELAPADLTTQLRLAKALLNSPAAIPDRVQRARELAANVAAKSDSAEAQLLLKAAN
ncbi:MAG: repeat-containing protein YrrB [Planctomycetaceae bacterium]|nr:repeat-containing protein YrrB [Planctomycetaceae bacterium]